MATERWSVGSGGHFSVGGNRVNDPSRSPDCHHRHPIFSSSGTHFFLALKSEKKRIKKSVIGHMYPHFLIQKVVIFFWSSCSTGNLRKQIALSYSQNKEKCTLHKSN
jgi:hypothetical protein